MELIKRAHRRLEKVPVRRPHKSNHAILARLAHIENILIRVERDPGRIGQTVQRQRLDLGVLQIAPEDGALRVLDGGLAEGARVREKEAV